MNVDKIWNWIKLDYKLENDSYFHFGESGRIFLHLNHSWHWQLVTIVENQMIAKEVVEKLNKKLKEKIIKDFDMDKYLFDINETIFNIIKYQAIECGKVNDAWKLICPVCGYETRLYRLHIETCAICETELGCND